MHLQEEAAFVQQGLVYLPKWGPAQLAEVLMEAWQAQEARNIDTQWVLKSGVENQLWIFRPTVDGQVKVVDTIENTSHLRVLPPSKGIAEPWAKARIRDSPLKENEKPEAPDYNQLAQVMIQLQEDPEPDDDENCLDFRVQGLDLTEDQIKVLTNSDILLQMDVPNALKPTKRQKEKNKEKGARGMDQEAQHGQEDQDSPEMGRDWVVPQPAPGCQAKRLQEAVPGPEILPVGQDQDRDQAEEEGEDDA